MSAEEPRGRPISYLALEPGTKVLSADGQPVGELAHVLADVEDDIFDGIIVRTSGGADDHVFVDASQVEEIRTDAVVLNLDTERCRSLPRPSANPPALQATPDDTVKEGLGEELRDKLRRAWDLMSGNY